MGINIRRARGVVGHISRFQNGEWRLGTTVQRGAFTDEDDDCAITITIETFYNCEDASTALYHEMIHAEQIMRGRSGEDWRRLEFEAYSAQNAMLGFLGRSFVADQRCIAFKWLHDDRHGYAFSPRPGWTAVGAGDQEGRPYTRWRNETTGAFEWLPAREGDHFQSGSSEISSATVEDLLDFSE